MEKYKPGKIEKNWQKKWEELNVFRAKNRSKKPKFYILVEFPYPSGEGLHVGHCRSYIGLDILARKRRMQGFNVLFPMGWDAFGLPTENYAIKTGVHPITATKKNTANFKHQEKSLGLSFDWSREINTTDPSYYKWTQWIFIQLFKNGLAYKDKITINWCPACKIGLANEEVIDGKCERCGARIERREKEQWMLKITKYAEKLIQDLEIVDYPERVKIAQKEWIGKSAGWNIKFQVSSFKFQVEVFTTRSDTLFGCTYLVLSPEHSIIEKLRDKITNYKFVQGYIEESKKKIEKERLSKEKEKTGIELKGIKAINPVNGRQIPIFVADYVLMSYGTGAIMAVPAHDQRDFDFAKRYNLSIIDVIESVEVRPRRIPSRSDLNGAYEGEGVLINSGRFTGMKSEDAKERITEWLAKKGLAKKSVHYKLRDWIFSRQRYWGESIPMINCQKCGWQPVAEKDLPVKLPKVKEYKPTETGDSPLAKVENWVKTKCPKCQGPAKRETDVMPNWAGSNWYYLRYCDPQNDKKLASQNLLKYWMPVDWYNGGMEHTTLHLLYSRFIYKFLWDIGTVPKSIGPEPYKKRTSHGMILGEGGIKMSKSRGNVINPDNVIKEYGADTTRVYEMFMGPFEQMIPWDTKGVKGARRFLEKIWRLQEKVKSPAFAKASADKQNPKLERLIHKTIKKVGEDIDNLKFNTAVSALMILVNEFEKQGNLSVKIYETFLKLLAPFAPHMAEELWQQRYIRVNPRSNPRKSASIFLEKWPKYDPKLIKEEKITLVIQINGKVRDKIEVDSDISEAQAKKIALSQEKVLKWIGKNKIKKIIFVKNKIINFVI